jgi:GTP-binding protein HflX
MREHGGVSDEIQRTYRGRADPAERPHDGPERAVVVASLPAGDPEGERDRLDELRELLRTAGVEAVEILVQHRQRPEPRTYLGRGRLEELIERVRELRPDVIVAEGALTAGQQRALEDRLSVRVIDRTALILDIFALHARTAEGKLQVELAQLEYNYARQEGLWQHLERLGGGVGTRGPGETQLEVDRRLIRTRMAALRRKLGDVARSRELRRKRRRTAGVVRVALAGYTNAGKSSLMNALTSAGLSAQDALFQTLDPTTRSLDHDGQRILLSDTVGFIRDLPHELVEAFASTLDEVVEADLVLHVADASEPEERRRARAQAVDAVLEEIGAGELPRLLVLNKIDLVDAAGREALAGRHPEGVQVSAATGEGLDALRDRLADAARERMVKVEITVPYARGDLIAMVHSQGSDVAETPDGDGLRMSALLPEATAGRLRAALSAPGP